MTAVAVTQSQTYEIKISGIRKLAEDWLNFVDVAESTFVTYNQALKNFVKWLDKTNVSTVNRETVIAYRDDILTRLSSTTCRLYISCVRLFVKFLASKGICSDFTAHFKGVKVSNDVHKRDALNVEESRQLFHSMTGGSEINLRDKAIVGLMLSTGLRCVEVSRLDIGDIEMRGSKIFLKIHGKGRQGKQDGVILPAQCVSLIKSYLKTRKNLSAKSPLFTSVSRRNNGTRLSTQMISRICKKNLIRAGYVSARLTAHSLRHSFATNAINAGMDIRQVSKALRHKSLIVTEIYLHDIDALNNQTTSTVASLIL